VNDGCQIFFFPSKYHYRKKALNARNNASKGSWSSSSSAILSQVKEQLRSALAGKVVYIFIYIALWQKVSVTFYLTASLL